MPRFSLSALFIALFVIALFCAALTYATVPWLDLVRTLVYFVLLTAAVSAFVSSGRAKAVAVGMAIFGLGFVYLGDRYSSTDSSLHTLFEALFDATHGPAPKRISGATPATAVSYPQPARILTLEEEKEIQEEQLYLIRHSCFSDVLYVGLTLLCTIFGGFVGVFFHSRSCSSPVAEASGHPPYKSRRNVAGPKATTTIVGRPAA